MTEILRIKREEAVLVAIDFQEKLLPAMEEKEKIEKSIIKLAAGLNVLGIPKLVTTQYARGLGQTVDSVAGALGEVEEFRSALEASGRKTVIITGIETHICVEQTTLDLMEHGYRVFLPVDCLGSRDMANHRASLERMKTEGAVITCGESVLYEILGGAKAPEFKAISAIVK